MSGWLHVITGPMFSGKTDFLIRKVQRYDLMGLTSIVFRPAVDTRTEALVSRSGLNYGDILTVNDHEDIWKIVEDDRNLLDVVAVDEAQFFGAGLIQVLNTMANHGHAVYAAGLDRDFMKRPFGPMPGLLVTADEVTKLTAVCAVCRREATLTQRLIDGLPATPDDPLVVIGGMGDERYEARCRTHWEEG